MGDRMTTPFRSRDLAIFEANCLADAICSHGVRAEVVVEGAAPHETLRETECPSWSPPAAALGRRWRWTL